MRTQYCRAVHLWFIAGYFETFVIDVKVYEDEQSVTLIDQDGQEIGSMCEPMRIESMLDMIIDEKFEGKVSSRYIWAC